MTFAPKRGLLTVLIGFPIFFGARTILEALLGREIDFLFGAIWSAGMALTFGIISTFSRQEAV